MPTARGAKVLSDMVAVIRDGKDACRHELRPLQTARASQAPRRQYPTVDQIAALREQAVAQGLRVGERQGIAQGLEAGRRTAELEARRLDKLLTNLALVGRGVDESVMRQLVALAMAVARALLQAELRARPELVTLVVRQAVALLVRESSPVRVHLHPDDVSLVNDWADARHLDLVADDRLAAGECVAQAGFATVDATFERRIGALAEALLAATRDEIAEQTSADPGSGADS